MKYRTKLYYSLVLVALTSMVVGLTVFSVETKKLIYEMLESRTLTVAATGAADLDTSLFARINKGTSSTSPEYLEARKALLRVLNANRRNDIYLDGLYTLFPSPDNPNKLVFGVDTNVAPVSPGTVYQDSDSQLILTHREEYFIDPNLITNQWGTWLIAYAPIKSPDGTYLSSLAAAVNISDIHSNWLQLVRFGIIGLSSSILFSLIIGYFLSKQVTSSLKHLCGVVNEVGSGDLNAQSKLETNDEFGQLSHHINQMTKGLKERDRLKLSFARYVSKHILDEILLSERPLKLEGERRKVTLLFSDIRQFTQLAEKLPPEEVVHLLNEYFEQMIEVIFSHAGTLDKFIGDGIMVEFGAPLHDDKQEEHAIAAAIQMQKALDRLCTRWESQGRPRVEMGIGIHTGEAVIGNIGSERRTEYTAIGDAVNVAARLEQATKILKAPILISESTYLRAKDKFPFKDLGTMALPGRKEQIRVYTIEESSS